MIEFRKEQGELRATGENEKDFNIIRSMIWSNKRAAYERKQERYRLREIMSNPYSCYRNNIVRIIQGKSPIPFNGYSSPIFSTTLSEVDEIFRSRNPLFVMGVRRDIEYKNWAFEDLETVDGKPVNEQDELTIIEMAKEEMEKEAEELKELLDLHNLGFIIFDGKYHAESVEGSYDLELGIEFSVLVPFTREFTGHVRYPKNEFAQESDFLDLGIELARSYNQESILIRRINGDFGVLPVLGKGKFFKLSDEMEIVKEGQVVEYMSRIHGDPENQWFTFPAAVNSEIRFSGKFSDREMSEIFSNLYTDRELKRICG